MNQSRAGVEQNRAPSLQFSHKSLSWRCFEIAACSLGLIVALPFLVVAAIAIKLEDGGPVFFGQVRVGRQGVPFRLLKLRSMGNGAAGALVTAAGDKRITQVGRFLRNHKLDEIPQLWNVLRNEMSLVGPRPEVPRYVDLNDRRWQKILSVRPGITDLATLLYRNEEALLASARDPEEFYRQSVLPAKLSLNVEYMQHNSWGQDLKLLVLSVCSSLWPGSIDDSRLREEFLSGSK